MLLLYENNAAELLFISYICVFFSYLVEQLCLATALVFVSTLETSHRCGYLSFATHFPAKMCETLTWPVFLHRLSCVCTLNRVVWLCFPIVGMYILNICTWFKGVVSRMGSTSYQLAIFRSWGWGSKEGKAGPLKQDERAQPVFSQEKRVRGLNFKKTIM